MKYYFCTRMIYTSTNFTFYTDIHFEFYTDTNFDKQLFHSFVEKLYYVKDLTHTHTEKNYVKD